MDPFTAALLGGTSLLSGGLSYLGSQKAAGAQQQAAQTSGLFGLLAQQQAIQAQREAAAQGVSALEKGQATGTEALRRGETLGAEALRAGQAQSREDILNQLARSEAAQREFYGQGVGYQQPYMTAGAGAVNQLASLFGPGGAYTQQPTMAELQMDPGYAFRLAQGEQALNSTLGSSGMRGSGAALKAATRYGQEAGSQEYQNAYNRFMANRAAATQGIQNLASGGLSAAGTATGLAGQTGANLGQTAMTAGTNLGQGALTTGANLGSTYTGAGANQANLAANTAGNIASTYTGTGANIANTMLMNPLGTAAENAAQARASGYMGGATALGQALQAPSQNYLAYSLMNQYAPQGTQYAGVGQLPGIYRSGGVLNSIFGS